MGRQSAKPLRHGVFYKAVYRPAVLRANRLAGYAALLPALGFHARSTPTPACASRLVSRESR